MTTVRLYRDEEDTERVDAFLVRMTSAEAPHRNCLQARWEVMHFHLMLDRDHCNRFCVWKVIEPAFGAEPGTQPPMEEP